MKQSKNMTTEKQVSAVDFCEYMLGIPFEGDIDNYKEVSDYLSKYLSKAKLMVEEITFNL